MLQLADVSGLLFKKFDIAIKMWYTSFEEIPTQINPTGLKRAF